MPESPHEIAIFIGVLLLALSWHEAAHAWVADRLGDPTARELGRVTLNPLRHLDPFLSVLLPGLLILVGSPFVFGGGKPVPIDIRQFRHPTRDFMLVALAGPGSNLLLAMAAGLIFAACVAEGVIPAQVVANPFGADHVFAPSILGDSDGDLLRFGLQSAFLFNIILAVFNMMPLPPLDGSRFVGWLLPRGLQPAWYRLDRIGLLLVVVVFFVFDGLRYVQRVFLEALGGFAGVVDQLAQTWLAAQ